MSSALERAASLGCWKGKVSPEPLGGGITNQNFVVEDGGERYFVRIGDDIIVHGVLRFNELAASRAAADAGISPGIVHHEPGALVMRFIEGETLTEEKVRDEANLPRVLDLVMRCHRDIPGHFRGPALVFWVFQVLRDYAATLREGGSRMVTELPRLMDIAARLERAVGPVDLVFGHNDLLAANFIDDGERLWLVDWDYAGFNSPLFDLGGLASNNELDRSQERWVLERYFDAPPADVLLRAYAAMKCASLLRESMWSMVSEIHSTLDFDYEAYTVENLERFERAWESFRNEHG
jgi:thiamine kinase-like enzyme